MKRSPLYSIFTGTCPRCHEGRVFLYKNPYNLKHIMEMNHYCPECGLNFKPETGFYFGATYVSYAIGVAIAVTISVGLSPWIPFFENFEIYALAIIGTITVLSPVIFRLSRHGWLKVFNKYDKDAIAKHRAHHHEVA
jgi:uncharacterized protein (DUF983 family)